MDEIPILTFEEAYERGSGWLAGGLKEIAYSSPVDVIEQEWFLSPAMGLPNPSIMQ